MSLLQTLVIIFEPANSNAKISGRRIFGSFVEENRTSFWNTKLVRAVLDLEYVGFMKPGTLFVSASRPDHLSILRLAWARRILKPADGFIIISLGDMEGIEIRNVEQLNFAPLADAVCDCIAKMNYLGCPVTVESLRAEIAKSFYTTMAPPSLEMIRKTIKNLQNAGYIDCLDKHLFVSLPASMPYHSLNSQNKCTVECQTGMSVIDGGDDKCLEGPTSKHKKGVFSRLFKKNSSARPLTKHMQSKKFSAQFPPTEWVFSPSLLRNGLNNINAGSTEIKRYCTFSVNLCGETENQRPSRHNDNVRCEADGRNPSKSHHENLYSESGDTRPPWNHHKTPYAEPRNCRDPNFCRDSLHGGTEMRRTLVKDGRRPSSNRREVTRGEAGTKKQSSNRYFRDGRLFSSSCECLDYGPIDPPECLPRCADAEVLDLTHHIRHGMKCQEKRTMDQVRTSTPLGRGSDSAYSVSPMVTEVSNASVDNYTSWSGSELPSADCLQNTEHTYANIDCTGSESTRFENITQIENVLPSSHRVSNI